MLKKIDEVYYYHYNYNYFKANKILGFLLDHFSVHRIKENNDTDSNNSNEIVNVDYR